MKLFHNIRLSRVEKFLFALAFASLCQFIGFFNSAHATPQRMTDKAGNVVWSADYDAYGKALVKTTANPALALVNNLRLPGQYYDAETGLHYNDRRYYDADTGRYLARDPIGFEGGINLYAYAAAAPNRYTDPTGEIIPCMAANYARCNVMSNLEKGAMDILKCGEVNWGKWHAQVGSLDSNDLAIAGGIFLPDVGDANSLARFFPGERQGEVCVLGSVRTCGLWGLRAWHDSDSE